MVKRKPLLNYDAESFIIHKIDSLLTKEESKSLKGEWLFKNYIPDRILPLGCKALHLDGPYFIEIKKRLLFDTLSRMKTIFEKVHKEFPNFRFLVVSVESITLGEIHIPEYIQLTTTNKLFDNEKHNKYVSDKVVDYKKKRKEIVRQARKIFQERNNVLVLGAGVSIDAGLPSWNELLERLLKNCPNCIANKEEISDVLKASNDSNLIAARNIRIRMGISTREEENSEFTKQIHDCLYAEETHKSELIDAICLAAETNKLKCIITYNYDDLVERELERRFIQAWPVCKSSHIFNNNLPIYHVHGIVPKTEKWMKPNPILTENAYHHLYQDAYEWSNIEQLHAFTSSRCFFIGLSMTDPNLRRLLETASFHSEGDLYHYTFLKKERQYRNATQNDENIKIQEKIMNEFGLNVIWFDEFRHLPILLNIINGSLPISRIDTL